MLRFSTGLPPDVLARFSLCLSLGQKGVPNPDEYNLDGTEMTPSHAFGKDERLYLALVLNRLRADKLDPETYLDDMTRAHINRGAIGIKQRINTLSDVYGLVKENETADIS